MTAILSLPPGDIYNLSVTACTERGSNTSMLRLVKLGEKNAHGCVRVCVYEKIVTSRELAFATLDLSWSSQFSEITEKWFTLLKAQNKHVYY